MSPSLKGVSRWGFPRPRPHRCALLHFASGLLLPHVPPPLPREGGRQAAPGTYTKLLLPGIQRMPKLLAACAILHSMRGGAGSKPTASSIPRWSPIHILLTRPDPAYLPRSDAGSVVWPQMFTKSAIAASATSELSPRMPSGGTKASNMCRVFVNPNKAPILQPSIITHRESKLIPRTSRQSLFPPCPQTRNNQPMPLILSDV